MIVVAKDSLVADGGRRFIAAGALVDDSDDIVKANPAAFRTVEEASQQRPDFVAGTKVDEVVTVDSEAREDTKPRRVRRS